MKNIFIDANILIDFFNKKSQRNIECVHVINLVLNHYKAITSPTCFAITYYFGKKAIKNNHTLNNQVKDFFIHFQFTEENEKVMKQVLKEDKFEDLEDALQYFSSKTADVDVIVTYNKHDYHSAKTTIYYPFEFILEHFNHKRK